MDDGTGNGTASMGGGSLGDVLNVWIRRRSVARASALSFEKVRSQQERRYSRSTALISRPRDVCT